MHIALHSLNDFRTRFRICNRSAGDSSADRSRHITRKRLRHARAAPFGAAGHSSILRRAEHRRRSGARVRFRGLEFEVQMKYLRIWTRIEIYTRICFFESLQWQLDSMRYSGVHIVDLCVPWSYSTHKATLIFVSFEHAIGFSLDSHNSVLTVINV